MPDSGQWDDEVIIDCLEDVLADVESYRKGHYGSVPLREETVSKVAAALRLLQGGKRDNSRPSG